MSQSYELSQHGYVRRHLFTLHIKGGLMNPDKTQKVDGYFYDKTLTKNAKICIDSGIASEEKDEFTEQTSSLRFDNYGQLKAYIFHLIRASVFLGKASRAITAENIEYHRQKDIEAIQEFYREVL